MRFLQQSLWSSPKSQKPSLQCMKSVINTTKCDVCLFLHKMCFKMVWKFCEIWRAYGNWLSDGPNFVRFYLTVWDMAGMHERMKLGSKCDLPEPPSANWNTNTLEVNICKVLKRANEISRRKLFHKVSSINHYLLGAVVGKWLIN